MLHASPGGIGRGFRDWPVTWEHVQQSRAWDPVLEFSLSLALSDSRCWVFHSGGL